MPESLTVKAKQAVLGGRPQEAGAILKEDLDCQVGEAILGSVIAEAVLLPVDGCGSGHPDQEGRATQSRFAAPQRHM